ncbi:hypothetical protein C8R43DRAFT_1175245 [Mycena crocata]|nr:hypothetical protein C8R43DRAFT_1175245 [Mycena crocata]
MTSSNNGSTLRSVGIGSMPGDDTLMLTTLHKASGRSKTTLPTGHVWSTQIEPGLTSILRGARLTVEEHMALYKVIYEWCSRTNPPTAQHGREMYQQLCAFYAAHTTQISEAAPPSNSLLPDYYDTEWTQFAHGVPKVNHLFAYLRHFIARERAESRKEGPGVDNVALNAWKDNVFDPLAPRLAATLGDENGATKLETIRGRFAAENLDLSPQELEGMYADGNASPYAVRALTRDPTSKPALNLIARGVECVKGSFEDFALVAKALEGSYGVWVNTDGFTVGDMREIYAGMRIFELASRTPSLRHYVWSSLPGASKITGYNLQYKAEHMDAKGRVNDWMHAQASAVGPDALSWTIVITGPYMDMLKGSLFSPLNVRKDGTVVFAAPIEDSQVPMLTLKDMGWWARWTFDHRAETSGCEVNIASDPVGWEYLVKTFTKVTGKPAVFKRQTIDEWWQNFDQRAVDEQTAANERTTAEGALSIRQNFTAVWRVLRDGVIKKDFDWIRSVHPESDTVEQWMRQSDYQGMGKPVLKNALDEKNPWGAKNEVRMLL